MPTARRRPGLLARALLGVATAAALAAGAAGVLWMALPDPSPLARHDPDTTALIEQRKAEAKQKKRPFRVRRTVVPLERVPPHLVQALVLSEDANFWTHGGVDLLAIQEAAQHDLRKGRFARGASTLTQQLAKNLWYGTEKSLGRKAKEAVLAWKLERALSKKRILALYLNAVEFGDGVFGIEAGARHRFGVGTRDLSPAQAVVMVAMLPAPLRVDLAHPSTWLQRRSRRLLDLMKVTGRLDAVSYRVSATELDCILAGPRPDDDREEPPEEAPPDLPVPAIDPAAGVGTRGAPLRGEGAAEAPSEDQGAAGTAGQADAAPSEQGGLGSVSHE
ncbi:MAG: biosynthetic peptidoglycan transglycosylase [Anaeromyxobacteraceae bacterium]